MRAAWPGKASIRKSGLLRNRFEESFCKRQTTFANQIPQTGQADPRPATRTAARAGQEKRRIIPVALCALPRCSAHARRHRVTASPAASALLFVAPLLPFLPEPLAILFSPVRAVGLHFSKMQAFISVGKLKGRRGGQVKRTGAPAAGEGLRGGPGFVLPFLPSPEAGNGGTTDKGRSSTEVDNLPCGYYDSLSCVKG